MKLVTTEVYEDEKSKVRADMTMFKMFLITGVSKGISYPIGVITWDVRSNIKHNLDNQQ